MLRAFTEPGGVDLARIALADGRSVALRLSSSHYRYRKEGELILSLRTSDSNVDGMSLAFALGRDAASRAVCYVGCIQGVEDAQEWVHTLTRALHGLRPRQFLFLALQQVAAQLGAERLLGPGETIHVRHRKNLFASARMKGFRYDHFWVEQHGELTSDGWYELPWRAARRSREEIPTRKRALYERRYAMLDDMARQARLSLGFVG